MRVVNLMSGMSSRLRPLTNNHHKVLLTVGHKTLIEYQLDAFNDVGIKEVIFVVGYKAEKIKSKIGNRYKDVKIEYIYNPFYLTKNINYSLFLARKEIKGENFIYMEADLIFHPSILKEVINSNFKNCLIVDQSINSIKVDTLITGNNNKANGLLFKKHGHFDNEFRKKYKSKIVGEPILIIKFDSINSKFLFDELDNSNFEGSTTLYSIFDKCLKKFDMNYIITEKSWIEIDNHYDLKKANKMFMDGKLNFIS